MMKLKQNLATIGDYKIKMTLHSMQRANQRKIDGMKIISAITAFGYDKLEEYNKNESDIMIKDKQNNISIVFAVHKKKITIITVIHDTDVYDRNYPDTVVTEI